MSAGYSRMPENVGPNECQRMKDWTVTALRQKFATAPIAESLGSPGISLMQKGAPVTYGPCILKPNNIHIRTKSGESDFGIVGFKPSTTCTKPVSSIQHTTNLRYKYYQWWLKAASATAYSDPGLTTTLVQKNIEHHCRGHVDTWFWGTAAGVINYGGKEYYARVYPDIARFSCRV